MIYVPGCFYVKLQLNFNDILKNVLIFLELINYSVNSISSIWKYCHDSDNTLIERMLLR
ncbi:hypothetical protein STAPHY8AQ_20457 [Staphylococcus sp. 8AQ]|nr:hypothetical protein STAPHY8AQ_20457 [Staphylococcus sp. 8AQ]